MASNVFAPRSPAASLNDALGARPQADPKTRLEAASARHGVPVNVLIAFAEAEGDADLANIETNARDLASAIAGGADLKKALEIKTGDAAAARAIGRRANEVLDAIQPQEAAPEAAPRGRTLLGDMARQFGGTAISGIGGGVDALGIAAEQAAGQTEKGEFRRFTERVGEGIRGAGEALNDTVSDRNREAMDGSTPDGDVLSPSSWSLGDDPSLRGYAMQLAGALGSMAPVVAASVLTRNPAVAAAAGAAQGGGAGADEARQSVLEMAGQTDADGKPKLAGAPAYQAALADGLSHDEAVARTADEAARLAFNWTAPVSGLGGAATQRIIAPVERRISGSMGRAVAGRGLLSAAEEATQEAAEGVATTHGTNQATGRDDDLFEGSFGDAVLGALGGGTVGAASGALDRRRAPRPEDIPEDEGMGVRPAPLALPAPDRAGPVPQIEADASPLMIEGPREPAPAEAAPSVIAPTAPTREPHPGFEKPYVGSGSAPMGSAAPGPVSQQAGAAPIPMPAMDEPLGVQPPAAPPPAPAAGPLVAAAARLTPAPVAEPAPEPRFPDQKPGSAIRLPVPGGTVADGVFIRETPDGAVVRIDGQEVTLSPVAFDRARTFAKRADEEAKAEAKADQKPAATESSSDAEPRALRAYADPAGRGPATPPAQGDLAQGDAGSDAGADLGLSGRAVEPGTGAAEGLAGDPDAGNVDGAVAAAPELTPAIIPIRAKAAVLRGVPKDAAPEVPGVSLKWDDREGGFIFSRKHADKVQAAVDGKVSDNAKNQAEIPDNAQSPQNVSENNGEVNPEVLTVAPGAVAPSAGNVQPDARALDGEIITPEDDARRSAEAAQASGFEMVPPPAPQAAPWWTAADEATRAAIVKEAGPAAASDLRKGLVWDRVSDDSKRALQEAYGRLYRAGAIENAGTIEAPRPALVAAPEVTTPGTLPALAETPDTAPEVTAPGAVAAAAAEVAPAPTDAQKEAGNYRKGHARWNGLDLSIETAKGQQRSGTDPTGQPWSVTMPADYGYFKRTEGADGDHVDFYMGPNEAAPAAFIIDQMDAETGGFDEHKVMLGFDSARAAREAHASAFSDGKGADRMGGVTKMSVENFKAWLKEGNTKAPLSPTARRKVKTVKPAATAPDQEPVKKPQRRPFIGYVTRTLGGVSPDGKFADELRHRGITPRTAPGLFRRGGHKDLDNIVASEHPELTGAIALSDDGTYLAPQSILDAIADEVAGQPLAFGRHSVDQQAARDVAASNRAPVAPTPVNEPTEGVAPRERDIRTDEERRSDVEREVEVTLEEMGLAWALTDAAKAAIIDTIDRDGGFIPDAIYDEVVRSERDDVSETPGDGSAASQVQDVPFGDEGEAGRAGPDAGTEGGPAPQGDRAGGTERSDRRGDGPAAGDDASVSSTPGSTQPVEEPGADGLPQTIIPGMEGGEDQRRSSLSARDRAEIEARQQQSKARRLDGNTGDAGPLFDDNTDLFDTPGPEQSAAPAPADRQAQMADDSDTPNRKPARIDDFGEKIGGARKDTADRGYSRSEKRPAEKSDQPAWRRQYHIAQIAKSMKPEEEGKWFITDKKAGRPVRMGYRQAVFDTEAEAEAAIPFYEVAKKHRVYADGDTFGVYRRVTDRKRVLMQGGFETREAADRYMAQNAVQLIETNTRIDDSIHPSLEQAIRDGEARRAEDADVDSKDFSEIFGFRAVEFGNWNNAAERQHILNQSYDALLDMAEIMQIPPRAVSLNGELALAFGSRGSGLTGARAHYERNYGAINLTKLQGAGALAHEWWHAFDHYLGRQDGKAKKDKITNERGDQVFDAQDPSKDYASHGFLMRNSGVRPEVREAMKKVVKAAFERRAEYTEDSSTRERIAQREVADLDVKLSQFRARLAQPQQWGRKKDPATAEQMAQVDRQIKRITDGDLGERVAAPSKGSVPFMFHEPVMALADIFKAVRGRQGYGFTQGRMNGEMHELQRAIDNKIRSEQLLAEAKDQRVKEKTVRTEFFSEAWKLDQGRTGDYWITNHEMTARAFESYVYDRLKEVGARNDFLAYEKHNDLPDYRMFNVKPYPEGQERQDMNAAFAELFEVIQSRETDQGVELYSRFGGEGEALTPESARQINAAARDELGRVGLLDKIGLKVEPGRLTGATGSYGRGVISILRDGAKGWRHTLDHEIIHALRDPARWGGSHGLFTQAEWRALVREARADADIRARVEKAYPDLDASGRAEEMVAELYAEWAAGRREVADGPLQQALDTIRSFFRAMASALRGNGFVDAARVMERVAAGHMGDRGPDGPGGSTVREQRDMDGAATEPGPSFAERFNLGDRMHRARGMIGNLHWRKAPDLFSDLLTDSMGKRGSINSLALVPGRALFSELGKNIKAAQRYLHEKEAMDAERNSWHGRGDTVARHWWKMRVKNRDANDKLMQLMHGSTRSGIDPSTPDAWEHPKAGKLDRLEKSGDPTARLEAEQIRSEIETRQRSYAKLKAEYDALPAEFQALYRQVRDEYTALADAMDAALVENMKTAAEIALKRAKRAHRKELRRIEDEGLSGPARDSAILEADSALDAAERRAKVGATARMAAMRQQFESNRLSGPYFPLARFGTYFVTIRDKAGKVVSFSRFETKRQQEVFVKDAEGRGLGTIERGALDQDANLKSMVDPRFVADVEGLLQDAGAGAEVMDAVWQHWLETLPDQSIRTNQIHRKNREGFNTDAFRAFGKQMFHGSHQLARLKHGLKMSEILEEAKEEAAASAQPERATFVVQEMERRHAFAMNPTGNPLTSTLTSIGFVWYLGMSPAAALVNISQTTLIGVPVMGHRFKRAGITGSTAAITKAMRDFADGRGWSEKSARLNDDEKAAMQEAYRLGTIDKTQAHDLASVADSGVEYSPVRQAVMEKIGFMFHHAERLNREVTFLANYRLARAEGLDQAQSVREASDLTWKIHFDYQNCVDGETEILTLEGWKRHNQLKVGDRIISTDDEGRAVEVGVQAVNVFKRPQEIALFSAKGPRKFSMAVTDDHRCVVMKEQKRAGKRGWSAPYFEAAKDLDQRHHLLRAPLAPLERADTIGPDMAALIGWFAAEGWFARNRGARVKNNVRLEQSLTHNPEHVAEIDGLLERLGGGFSRHLVKDGKHVLWSLSGDLAKAIREACPDKLLTWEMFAIMSADEMSALLDAFARADGTVRGKNGCITISQKASTNRQNLEVLQAMATVIGRPASIGEGGTRDCDHLMLAGNGLIKTTKTGVINLTKSRLQVPMVWCPTTDNGRWIARRNGVVFVTGNSARPRVMQGDVAKVVLLFRSYTVNLLWRMFRDAHQSFNGDTKEARAEARSQLVGITLSMMAHAGIRGVWGYGLLMTLLGMFFPDGDDEAEKWLENALLMEGDDAGTAAWNWTMGLLLNGVPGHATGVDLTQRIGSPNLWFRESGRNLEGTDAWNHVVNDLLGPIFGIGAGIARGAGMAGRDPWRGVEAGMPKFIRDGMQAYRFATEGATTLNGDPLIEDMGPGEVLAKVSGFTPARLSERYKINNRIKNQEQRITRERQDIHRAVGRSVRNGEPIDDHLRERISEFNRTYPFYPITADTIRQSVRGQLRASSRNEGGVQLNPRLDRFIREGQAPALYSRS